MTYEDITECLENALHEYTNGSISLRELSLKYHISRQVLTGYMLGKNIDIYSKKSRVNNYAFSEIKSEEQAYWLGFLYADGSVSHYKNCYKVDLTLQEQDYGHLIKFSRFVDYQGQIKHRKELNAYRVCFGSKRMHDDLVRLGCVENKSLVLKFPKPEIVPDNLRRHFVRGYFDGDGHLDVHLNVNYTIRKTVSLLGTYDFLSWLLFYLPFNIQNRRIIKKCKDNDSDNYYFQLRKNESALFLDYIYKDCSIYLDRKYLNYLA